MFARRNSVEKDSRKTQNGGTNSNLLSKRRQSQLLTAFDKLLEDAEAEDSVVQPASFTRKSEAISEQPPPVLPPATSPWLALPGPAMEKPALQLTRESSVKWNTSEQSTPAGAGVGLTADESAFDYDLPSSERHFESLMQDLEGTAGEMEQKMAQESKMSQRKSLPNKRTYTAM